MSLSSLQFGDGCWPDLGVTAGGCRGTCVWKPECSQSSTLGQFNLNLTLMLPPVLLGLFLCNPASLQIKRGRRGECSCADDVVLGSAMMERECHMSLDVDFFVSDFATSSRHLPQQSSELDACTILSLFLLKQSLHC